MYLYGNAVSDLEFIYRGAKMNNSTHIFMPDGKILTEWRFTLYHSWQAVLHNFDIRSAHGYRVNAHQYFGIARLRHRLFG
jgi:hypothetical protein